MAHEQLTNKTSISSQGLDRPGLGADVAFVDEADEEPRVDHAGDVQDGLVQPFGGILPDQRPKVHVKHKVAVVYTRKPPGKPHGQQKRG